MAHAKAQRRKKQGRAREMILKFAAILDVKFESLEWQPIERGGEMCGPSGGWICRLESQGETYFEECYGYNAEELCESMVQAVIRGNERHAQNVFHRCGVASAAKEKDAQIEALKRQVAAGFRQDQIRVENEIKAGAIDELLRAVSLSGECEPPMRDMWVIQVLAERHFGKWWRNAALYEAPDKPIVFAPLEKSERRKYHDSSPWQDLAIIRKAAGTQDTDAIVKMLQVRLPE